MELISYCPEKKIFHLSNGHVSYVIGIERNNYLAHLYWGKAVRSFNFSAQLNFYDRGFSPNPQEYYTDRTFSLDTLPQEFGGYGKGDFRPPAYQAQLANGTTITDLRYVSHKIINGKPKLQGLPATYVLNDDEAKTLELTCTCEKTGLEVILVYTIFRDYDVITRNVRFTNKSNEQMRLLRALSMSVDFRDNNFDVLSMYGAHCNERMLQRKDLSHGTFIMDSVRGASSHQFHPFLALARKKTDEVKGDVYAFNFVYSGNFMALTHVDQFNNTRVMMGINAFDFSWLLEAGESFQTPEVVMNYSSEGLNHMSNTFHRLYRERLCRGKFQYADRPILINNWEATYFDFNSESIYAIASKAKELGIELMVLDDGWFGKRNDDNSSLGDWEVNEEKLPGGIGALADRVAALGMRFGIWFEPEMVSVESNLYKAHPEWALQVPKHSHTFGRNQLILDLGNKEVQEYIVSCVSKVLDSGKISYVKWDMNRHMTEIGSTVLPPESQRETAHRYMLGLYHVLETITQKYTDVLFESCSGGGGRFDPGLLHYMPQTWTSDDTDAVCRQKIQYSTSLIYPPVSMGSHVSVVPNHQVGRVTPMNTRGNCAMSGNLGYELNITKSSEEDLKAMADQIAFYKTFRHTVQYGRLHRILSPFDGNETAWNFVAEDGKQVVAMYFKILAEPNGPETIFQLQGLDPEAMYKDTVTGKVYGGDELMNVGLTVPIQALDYASCIWVFERV